MSDSGEEIIEISKNELEELVQNKVKEELRNQEDSTVKQEKDVDSKISRRGFLKKLGVGAASLGAFAVTPAAANINFKHDGSVLFNSDDVQVQKGGLEVEEGDVNVKSGNIDVQNGNINLNGNNLSSVGKLRVQGSIIFDRYGTKSEAEGNLEEGEIVYIKEESKFFFENGESV